jgi:hypothetical protein
MEETMHCRVYIFSLAAVLGVMPSFTSLYGQGLVSSPSQTVRGEVLTLDGAYVYVKDAAGKEVKLHTDQNTMTMDGAKVGPGDNVTADVTPTGHATFIIKQDGAATDNSGQEPQPR